MQINTSMKKALGGTHWCKHCGNVFNGGTSKARKAGKRFLRKAFNTKLQRIMPSDI